MWIWNRKWVCILVLRICSILHLKKKKYQEAIDVFVFEIFEETSSLKRHPSCGQKVRIHLQRTSSSSRRRRRRRLHRALPHLHKRPPGLYSSGCVDDLSHCSGSCLDLYTSVSHHGDCLESHASLPLYRSLTLQKGFFCPTLICR